MSSNSRIGRAYCVKDGLEISFIKFEVIIKFESAACLMNKVFLLGSYLVVTHFHFQVLVLISFKHFGFVFHNRY